MHSHKIFTKLSLSTASALMLVATAWTTASHARPASSSSTSPPLAAPSIGAESKGAIEAIQSRTAPPTSGTVLEVASQAGQFTTLVAAIEAAGLTATLNGAGPFTVFAPSDAAFAKLPAGTVENLLMPENKAKLASILSYHVLPGRLASSNLASDAQSPATLQGATLQIDNSLGIKVGGALVTSPDIAASNGVIHVIDTVLMPPTR
jgi:uncharacterized surface protein with fasciclin (FAS1) repeats